jgi:hypothetical protein
VAILSIAAAWVSISAASQSRQHPVTKLCSRVAGRGLTLNQAFASQEAILQLTLGLR